MATGIIIYSLRVCRFRTVFHWIPLRKRDILWLRFNYGKFTLSHLLFIGKVRLIMDVDCERSELEILGKLLLTKCRRPEINSSRKVFVTLSIVLAFVVDLSVNLINSSSLFEELKDSFRSGVVHAETNSRFLYREILILD